ncbi:PPOX class F420-dependent oxidoreductase [Microbacterium sp. CJ88]|uniref:PPOX class F420-dependent oxidoreductase n=1 Tax=Microbacterium sp. CJ88 TaxID=3445672 RepID=UPI003F657F09
MYSADEWSRIADSHFVSLVTYRKSGAIVATPVWIAAEGDDLVVTTERSTGKVKRLRRNASVSMRPCTRMGHVADDAITVAGTAALDEDQTAGNRALAAKYGLQFKIFLALERLVRRVQRKPGQRVIVRISRTIG